MLTVSGNGLQQAVEPTIGGEQVPAAEWLKDALADAAAGFADALDEVKVAVATGGLLDDEHRAVLRIVYAQSKEFPSFLPQMLSLQPGRTPKPASIRSTTYEASFLGRSLSAVQVRQGTTAGAGLVAQALHALGVEADHPVP